MNPWGIQEDNDVRRIRKDRRLRLSGLIVVALMGIPIISGAEEPKAPVKITFENVTEALGLGGLVNSEAYWVDCNNDSWTDLQDVGRIWPVISITMVTWIST